MSVQGKSMIHCGVAFDEVNSGSNYTEEQVKFLKAVDNYKRISGKQHLDCRDILRVAKSLGYSKEDKK